MASLDIDEGAQASNNQALRLRETRIIDDQMAYYEDQGFGLKNYDGIKSSHLEFLDKFNPNRVDRNYFKVVETADYHQISIKYFKNGTGGDYTFWNHAVDNNGRTVGMWHDFYKNGQYSGTSWKIPGPQRHYWADGRMRIDGK